MTINYDQTAVRGRTSTTVPLVTQANADGFAVSAFTAAVTSIDRIPAEFDIRFGVTSNTIHQPATFDETTAFYVGLGIGVDSATLTGPSLLAGPWRSEPPENIGYSQSFSDVAGEPVILTIPTAPSPITATTADGFITSQNADWDAARNVAAGDVSLVVNTTGDYLTCQADLDGDFYVSQAFIPFDTSGRAFPNVSLEWVVSLFPISTDIDEVMTLELWVHPWATPGTLAANDWVPGTTLQTMYDNGQRIGVMNIGDDDITFDSADWVNPTGTTYLLVTPSYQRTGQQPTGTNKHKIGAVNDGNPAVLTVSHSSMNGNLPCSMFVWDGPNNNRTMQLLDLRVNDAPSFAETSYPPDNRQVVVTPPSPVRFREPFLDTVHQITLRVTESELPATANNLLQPYHFEITVDGSPPFSWDNYTRMSELIICMTVRHESSDSTYRWWADVLTVTSRPAPSHQLIAFTD